MNINFLKHRTKSFLNRLKDSAIRNKNSYEKDIEKDSLANEYANQYAKTKYSWRGLHIDVARHYMPIEYIKELIVKISELDFNILHLHLTDDQGWRFESKKYPNLHLIGSKRKETVVEKSFSIFENEYKGDGIEHAGYYTQDELKELVNFAKSKNINIVPEIDIPGHSTAMLAAYPHFAASYEDDNKKLEVATYWGVFPNVVSPSRASIQFLKDVFEELIEIFDSKYIHIGGDEVPTDNYREDKYSLDLVEKGIIETYEYTPEYILQNIAKFIKSKNRIPVMWDDAWRVAKQYDGIVMVWQSMQDMEKVLKHGVKTVCCSSSHFYLDYYQHADIEKEPLAIGGYISIEKILSAREILEDKKFMSTKYYQNLIGIQANMWTEYTKTPDDVDYMLFPRLNSFASLFKKEL